jgi:hypothetical protein
MKNMKNKGISNILTFATISLVILLIGFSVYYIVLQQAKSGQQIITSEERKAESQLAEKLSLIYWGVDGVIVANDGEKTITITKIYVETQIIPTNIIINPDDKTQITNIPYGENLENIMFESSSGAMIKLEKPKPIITEPCYYSETQGSQSQTQSQQQTSQSFPFNKTTSIATSFITTITRYSTSIITLTSYLTTMTLPWTTQTLASITTQTSIIPITTITSTIPTTFLTTLRTTFTSTITTEIPITTYSIYTTITSPTSTSYTTTTSTSYSTTLTTTTSTWYERYAYTTETHRTTITSTITTPKTTITSTSSKLYNTTITFASPYTTYKTTTYTTTIDPIIKNAYPIFDNSNAFLISVILLAFIFVYSIIFNHYLRRAFYEE